MRRALFACVALLAGCKLTGQDIDPRPYSETVGLVEAARKTRQNGTLAAFSRDAEAALFAHHWKYAGWAECLRKTKGKVLYDEFGDQACYSGYLTAGLVYNYLNDPSNPTKKAHLRKALAQHRLKTLACGRRGYLPRGFTSTDCPVKGAHKFIRCKAPYEGYMYYARGPSPGQYMGTLYGLHVAVTHLKGKDVELYKLSLETLKDICDDLVTTGFTLKKPDGFPTDIPFFLLRGPKVFLPGVGHITMGYGKYKKTYVNLAEKYNLNCLAVMSMAYHHTRDPKFLLWYDTFVKEGRHRNVYRATIEIGDLRVGKGSSHLGTMAALAMLLPTHPRTDATTREYEKALRVWWQKTASWENALWYGVYYELTGKDRKRLGAVIAKRLKTYPKLPRREREIVNSNRPDLPLKRKGISGYVAKDPLPWFMAPRMGFYPVKTPFKLDAGGSKKRWYGSGDFVLCYQYARFLKLIEE